MSQNAKDKADAAEARTQETRGFMQQVRVAASRLYTDCLNTGTSSCCTFLPPRVSCR